MLESLVGAAIVLLLGGVHGYWMTTLIREGSKMQYSTERELRRLESELTKAANTLNALEVVAFRDLNNLEDECYDLTRAQILDEIHAINTKIAEIINGENEL